MVGTKKSQMNKFLTAGKLILCSECGYFNKANYNGKGDASDCGQRRISGKVD